MNDKRLIVSEVFASIQGEGQTMGIPCVFLRLAGCNLLCANSSGWTCDTIEVWKHGKITQFHDVLSDEHIEMLKHKCHLVVTGGEPLKQQAALVRFFTWLTKQVGFKPSIEVETNGTVVPVEEIKSFVRFWNVSPKLSNSGETYERRVNPMALQAIKMSAGIDRIIWKFVVSNEGDVLEILQDYGDYINLKYGTMLMPAGATQEELSITRPIVAELCKKYRWRYSDRLHIGIWNQKTGV